MTITKNSQAGGFTAGAPAESGTRRGPIVRIVAGSMATGAVAAAALTLLVFAGAPEHVITGSALVGFAIGWAMLAGLSSRFTSQPQRWAVVPAALMAVTGAGLLVVAPGESAISAAGWVWPPAAFALAAWMTVQVRRSLHTRARAVFVYPVLAALAAGSIGGGYATVRQQQDRNTFAMPGQSYDVGGRTLHLNCTGTGSPTVVLENGLGEMSPMWSRITGAVGHTTRVCAYDRAGQGWSGDAPDAHDGVEVASDLHTLLDVAGEVGPYVLVGHSIGGTYALTYAAQYPADVAGVVLLDSASPYQFTVLPKFEREYAMGRSAYGVLPSAARLGISRLMPTSFYSQLPSPAAEQVRAFAASPRGARNSRDEHSQLRAAFTQAQALTSLRDTPLVVVTAREELSTSGWAAAQDHLAALSTNSSHRVADSTHVGLLDDANDAAASVDAINDVVQSVRTGSAVTAD